MQQPIMAVIGLGMIGSSLAAALRGFNDYQIVGWDGDPATNEYARQYHLTDHIATNLNHLLKQAKVTFICLPPQAIIDFLQQHRDDFSSGSLVTDVCGIKTAIMKAAQALPTDIDFIGGHPMAGKEHSGVKHGQQDLFVGAHYIITPSPASSPHHLELLQQIASHIGCRDAIISTASEHDRYIAYTSQLMHIISLAICDSPDYGPHQGFEGNSFREFTRIANMNISLWQELFTLNAPALTKVIAQMETDLHTYRLALESGDRQLLKQKISTASARKKRES